MKSEVQLHQAAVHCPNCDTQLGGKFCQGCGQPAYLHVPSAREFLPGQADAMRRVYGGSHKVTALRWIVLMTLHMLSIATAIALATALAPAG